MTEEEMRKKIENHPLTPVTHRISIQLMDATSELNHLKFNLAHLEIKKAETITKIFELEKKVKRLLEAREAAKKRIRRNLK